MTDSIYCHTADSICCHTVCIHWKRDIPKSTKSRNLFLIWHAISPRKGFLIWWIHQIEKPFLDFPNRWGYSVIWGYSMPRFLGISWCKFTMRFHFNLKLNQGICISRFGGFRGCSVFSGYCQIQVLGYGVATISRLLKIIGLFCRI